MPNDTEVRLLLALVLLSALIRDQQILDPEVIPFSEVPQSE